MPIFRSRLQGELLALVPADPARQWTIDELTERIGEPYQTVATEVRRLQDAELLVATTIGRTKLLSANEANAYRQPLSQLATMAFGPPVADRARDRATFPSGRGAAVRRSAGGRLRWFAGGPNIAGCVSAL